MKKLFLGFLLFSTFFSTFNFSQTTGGNQTAPKNQTATAAAKQTGIEVPFVNKVLSNGFEIIVLPDKSVPIVTVEIAARNGSFTETPELNGLSHLYEHMFFKPNLSELVFRCLVASQNNDDKYLEQANCRQTYQKRSSFGQLADEDILYLNDRDRLNISNGRTQEEVVDYFFTTASENLKTAIHFINDAIRYPTFDPQELEEEKKVVIGEIDRNEANPFYYLQDEMNGKLFYQFPTRKKPLGTRATVSNATVEQMRLIESRYYVPNNTALVVTGDVNPQEVFDYAEKIFGDWKKREKPPFEEFPLVDHPPLEKSAGYFVEQPVQNVLLQIGWQGPSVGKDDAATYAADVFSFILTQPNSRFQRKMVDSGLAAETQLNYYTQRNVGPITALMVTSPDKAKAVLKAIYAEIAHFTDADYFTDEELASAKTILDSRDLYEREELSDYAHTLSFWWSSTGIDYFRGYHKNLRAVSRADINRYIKTYIQNRPRVGIALLSSDAKKNADLTEQDLIGGSK